MLRKAVGLLGEAGWSVQDTGLANAAGEPFAFTISVQTKDQEKIALDYQRSLSVLGIKADVRLLDNAQFQSILNSYDYDMVPVTWYNSLSPGNEQKFYYRFGWPQDRRHAELSRHSRSRCRCRDFRPADG